MSSLNHAKEVYYCWMQPAKDDQDQPILVTPWADPYEHEFAFDFKFETPELARQGIIDWEGESGWILCKMTVEPLAEVSSVGQLLVEAEVHSDDQVEEAEFDATPWFNRASDQEIIDLAKCGWGGDYDADYVARYMEDLDENVARVLNYDAPNIGYECHVDAATALAWLKEYRPHLVEPVIAATPPGAVNFNLE